MRRREARRCEFHVKASSAEEESNVTAAAAGGNVAGALGAGRGRRGLLRAPSHTLPPNTTCTWTFHGRPGQCRSPLGPFLASSLPNILSKYNVRCLPVGDLVWIYFSSFKQYSLVESRRADSAEREEDAAAATSAAPPPSRPTPAAQPAAGAPCAVQLRIWDGGGAGAARLVGQYCDAAPALCARAALANATRVPRPCSPPDG